MRPACRKSLHYQYTVGSTLFESSKAMSLRFHLFWDKPILATILEDDS